MRIDPLRTAYHQNPHEYCILNGGHHLIWHSHEDYNLHVHNTIMYININERDVQRKNVVNNVDKSSLWAPWQNGPYKNTQNITKHRVYKDATDIKK